MKKIILTILFILPIVLSAVKTEAVSLVDSNSISIKDKKITMKVNLSAISNADKEILTAKIFATFENKKQIGTFTKTFTKQVSNSGDPQIITIDMPDSAKEGNYTITVDSNEGDSIPETNFNYIPPTTNTTTTPTGDCAVKKAGFFPNGEANDGFYKESNRPTVSIVIQTENCADQELKLTVKELDRCLGSAIPGMNCNDALSDSNLENRPVKITATNAVTLNFLAGEEECGTASSTVGLNGLIDIADGHDCLYYFELLNPKGDKWSSMDSPGGRLAYECDGICKTDWEQKGDQEDTVDPGALDARIAKDEYTLLAPIGSIAAIDKTTTLGDYLNLMIKIFLGICGALAVIMIVIYGIQWMGTDSVFTKTESKQKIGGALAGLILALASWMLLNTINPDLLGGELSIGQASIEVEGDAMDANDELPPLGSAVARCPEGIYQAQTAGGIFPVCKTMQENLKKMIDLAWSEGVKITGFGFRSKKRQEELRAQNCGGVANVYRVGARCKPQTAIPGTSMHESGLAFDLRCEGLKIATTDNSCYKWLEKNAGRYGLKNLAGEPWHWSTTGH